MQYFWANALIPRPPSKYSFTNLSFNSSLYILLPDIEKPLSLDDFSV